MGELLLPLRSGHEDPDHEFGNGFMGSSNSTYMDLFINYDIWTMSDC